MKSKDDKSEDGSDQERKFDFSRVNSRLSPLVLSEKFLRFDSVVPDRGFIILLLST
jgi:hypothetical protein